MNRYGVENRVGIRSQKGRSKFRVFAVRMPGGIEPRISVEIGGLDNKGVAIPVTHRRSIPGSRQIRGPFEVRTGRNPGVPGVLLKKEGDRIVVLKKLRSMRRVDISRPSKRQATA